MFNKPKNNPPQPPKSRSDVPVPPLPDLPSPGQQNGAASPQVAAAAAPATAASATPSPARGASVLARDLVFEGNISGDGELTIDGQVKGDVRVNRLIVGDTGSVEGTVQADNVDVKGRVVGAVQGKNVKLLSTAYVDGDINHEQLAIEVGAYFQGRCLQNRPGQAAASAPAAAGATAPAASPAAPVVTPALSAGAQGEVVSLKPNA
ncbi:MAG: polymer-forming cytoskeletal protein [Caulobacterales bacterium]|nr:polymer-forming cytoskeletal protein [Caulobacterales bacterium]